MHLHGLLLARHKGYRPDRSHDGKVITLKSNLRWCSDGFEIHCDNGEVVRVVFALDCCDREAMGAAQRCSSPSSSPSSSLRFEPADALSAAEHIERILGREGDPDHRWRCLGLEPGAGTLPRTLLRKRFLALALLVHPDKCHLEGAHEAFAALEKAFRELINLTRADPCILAKH
jgi:hypothetical protein